MKNRILSFILCFVSFVSIAQINQGTQTLSATNNITLTVTVNNNNNDVEIIITGPSSNWHAVGFGGGSMNNTYALIVDGSGNVQERKLGFHNGGTVLSSSLTSTNTVVNSGIRTTTIVRPRSGLNSNYYTFSSSPGSFMTIWARGLASSLNNHGSSRRGSSMFTTSNICNIATTVLPKVNICNGDSALIFGEYYKSNGTFLDTLVTPIGCDSVLSQELAVNPDYNNSLPLISICEGDSVNIFGTYRSTSGIYTDSLSSSLSCDSIVSQQLDVISIDTGITVFTDSIAANQSGNSYQWYDCDLQQVVSGATSQTFVPANSGTYQVIISNGSCADTSTCVAFGYVSIAEMNLAKIKMYPNPARELLKLDNIQSETSIELYNLSGVLIYKANLLEINTIDLSAFKSGVYLVKLTQNDFSETRRLIIQ